MTDIKDLTIYPWTLYFYRMKYMILGKDGKYYNTLAYTRKLSEEEETKYELTYLGVK